MTGNDVMSSVVFPFTERVPISMFSNVNREGCNGRKESSKLGALSGSWEGRDEGRQVLGRFAVAVSELALRCGLRATPG